MADDVPLPGAKNKKVWLTAGGLAGAFGLFWWWRRRQGQAAAVDPNAADPNLAAINPGLTGSVTTPGLGLIPSTNPPNDTAVLPAQSDAEWVERAIDLLQGWGWDAALVATTLGKYITRQPLTAQEQDIVRTAQGALGLPPNQQPIVPIGTPSTPNPPSPPPPPPPVPTPAPAPAPAPSPQKTPVRYQIQHNDTLTSIAAKFHGQYGTTVALLKQWNMAEMDASARHYGHASSNNGDLIFGGQWLTVGWK